MKEVLIFFSICLISASVHENGATKLGHKSVRHRKLFNERWRRDNLVRKEKGKRLKLNSSDKKEDASYMKRQFVPEMPAFFNFPHPHIHRIIVHHHPAHSTCEPIPCQNGGTCTVVAHGYECTCSPGFMGTHCELRSQCEPNPCRNGGTCYDVGQGYECTCSKGYRGQNCEEQNKCHPNPCRNGGTCTGINEGEGFECTCREGFKGKNCEEINLCLPNPCKNGATCTERVGGRYECTCPIGYKGITCEERSICYSNPCMNGGTCLDETYGYRCSCRMGYSGMNCQNHVCRPNPCHNGGSCLEEGSSYRCVCHVGNHGDRCELLSSCLSHPCLHGGTCIDTYFLHNDINAVDLYSSPSFVDSQQNAMAYICKCIAPFAGRNCEDDSCRYCSPNAECILGHCVCKESYHGDGKTCKRNVCHPNPCKNSGTCVPTDSSYDCECMLGWTGPHCETRQYCIPNPCKNGGTCIPEESGYRCTCLHNYEGNDCELANPCSPNPCKNSGTCKEMNGVATCECPAQFEGNFCDVDKCAKCDSHARCDNGNCICMEGWVGDGQTCSPQTETPSAPASLPSPPSPPPPSLPAIVGAPGSPGNSYGSPSSYGPPSDMPTAPTSRASPCDSNPCQNGGQCLDEGNAYQCLCKEGFSGNNCELGIGKTNPCDPNPCQNGGQCTAVDSKPVCACPEEFEGNFCEMPKGGGVGGIPGTGGGVSLNSACHPNPCMNGGSCTENGGGYDCACVVQYSGPNCEIDECEKCDIHALCANGHCRCKSGYYGNGYQCEKEESECEGCSPFASCQNGICVCLEQYTGNGYDCAPVNPCTSCRPPNICVQGSCLPGMTKKSHVKNIKKKRFVPKGEIV